MTFTKEQLLDHLDVRLTHTRKAAEDNAGTGWAEFYEKEVAVLEMALAGMESEPVFKINHDSSLIKHVKKVVRETSAPQPLTTSERAELENYRNAQQVVPGEPSIERLEEVLEWISGLPVPTKSATANYCRLKNFITDFRAAMLQGKAEPVTTAYKLPPHVYRELVNSLRDTAVKYQGCQQLREQISETLSAVITHTPHCGNSPVIPDCWCRTCRPVKMNDMRFVVCPDCGNKRCPHANDHRNACTGSNEPGQEGSAYPAAPQQEAE